MLINHHTGLRWIYEGTGSSAGKLPRLVVRYHCRFASKSKFRSLILVRDYWWFLPCCKICVEMPRNFTMERSSKDILLIFCRIFTWHEVGRPEIEVKAASLEETSFEMVINLWGGLIVLRSWDTAPTSRTEMEGKSIVDRNLSIQLGPSGTLHCCIAMEESVTRMVTRDINQHSLVATKTFWKINCATVEQEALQGGWADDKSRVFSCSSDCVIECNEKNIYHWKWMVKWHWNGNNSHSEYWDYRKMERDNILQRVELK